MAVKWIFLWMGPGLSKQGEILIWFVEDGRPKKDRVVCSNVGRATLS